MATTAVVVPVVVTQTGDDDPEVTDALTSVTDLKDIPTTILNNEIEKTISTTTLKTNAATSDEKGEFPLISQIQKLLKQKKLLIQ